MGIQFPTTEFEYAGKLFSLIVSIGTVYDILLPVESEKTHRYQMLSLDNIQRIEILNSLNQLCMSGTLIYKDIEGYITDLQNRSNIVLTYDLKRLLVVSDGDMSIKKIDEDNTFQHSFLVDKIEILARDKEAITYKLYLTSINYNGLIKTIHYSNYSKDPEKTTSILQQILKRAASSNNGEPLFNIDESLEDNGDAQSNVSMHYTTNGNDNSFTIAKFLLNKMFYFRKDSKQQRDDSVKFIYYDQYSNSYGLFDLAKLDLTKARNDQIILSMFSSSEESMAYEKDCQLASVAQFPMSKLKKSMFGTHTYDYDFAQNGIIHDYVSQKNIADYHDKTDDTMENVKKQIELENDPKNPDYANNQPYWNNNYNIYNMMVDSLLEDNALIVNTGPNIRRVPANIVIIDIPPNRAIDTTDTYSEYENVAGRYGQLQGEWIIGKVRNIISRNPKNGSLEYTQNLIMFKNFLIDDKKS